MKVNVQMWHTHISLSKVTHLSQIEQLLFLKFSFTYGERNTWPEFHGEFRGKAPRPI